MKSVYCAALFVLGLLTACGGDGGAKPPRDTILSREGCEPKAGGNPHAVTDRNGPYYHQVAVADSPDGASAAAATQLLDHASVPDGVRRADGTLLVYYINGEDGALWAARLQDTVATPIGHVWIDGIEAPVGAVDPDASLLANGDVRLTYLGDLGPPSATHQPGTICIADSKDGIHFTVRGRAIRFDDTVTTDPSLVQLKDGSWLMAVSQGQTTVLARSSDGLSFERAQTLTYGGVPELATLPDGRLRLYVCARGIESYLSSDNGLTWAHEGSVVRSVPGGKKIICDPSYVQGAGILLYKTAD